MPGKREKTLTSGVKDVEQNGYMDAANKELTSKLHWESAEKTRSHRRKAKALVICQSDGHMCAANYA